MTSEDEPEDWSADVQISQFVLPCLLLWVKHVTVIIVDDLLVFFEINTFYLANVAIKHGFIVTIDSLNDFISGRISPVTSLPAPNLPAEGLFNS